MTIQKHETPHAKQAPADEPDDAPEGASPLLAQASAFGSVAREAHADCKRGEEAQRELEARRNSSGQ